jgi:acyl-CoA synthetase (AMP-forming)/AMP-acid ligase II
MNLKQVLARATKLFPRETATICGDHHQTYIELRRRVDRLASALQRRGVVKGDRVALLMLNCHRYLETVFACFEIGAVIVPINVKLPPEEIAFIVSDTECVALFTDDVLEPLAAALRPGLSGVRSFITTSHTQGFDNYEQLLEQSNVEYSPTEATEDEMTAIFYTSGTTGRPKGLMHTHKTLWMNALHCIATLGLRFGEVHLHGTPIFHLSDFPAVLTTTEVGGTHVLLKDFDPQAFIATIERHRVTTILVIPIMLHILLQSPSIREHDLSSLRCVFYGTTPMPVELLKLAMSLLPNCAFIHGYGQSESAGVLTVLPFEDHLTSGPEHLTRRLASCGREIIGVEVQVLDEADEPVRPGEVGEIVTRNPSVMQGYWKREAESAAVLRGGWLRTGDMATVDEDGYIFLIDRKKNMILTHGEKVFSTEVEEILQAHDAVREAAVIGVPDRESGEVVKAIVRLKEDHSLSEDDLIDFCAARLSAHKVPGLIEITSEELPKNWSGKIKKKVLLERHLKA